MDLVAANGAKLDAISCQEPLSLSALVTATPAWWEHVAPGGPPAATAAYVAAEEAAVARTIAGFYADLSFADGAHPDWSHADALLTDAATVIVDGRPIGHLRNIAPGGWPDAVRPGLTRVERSRTIAFEGPLAQVRSTYETRRSRDGLVLGEGQARFTLVHSPDGQWKIAVLAWDTDRAQIAGSPAAH